jgi:uncharacterized protein YecE (DUF72 family)
LQQSLFPEPEESFKHKLAKKLLSLAKQGILLGGSSWKYEGWIGSIYSPERYRTNGRFSKKLFDQECLLEYAETFPVVCGDFAFYQFPTSAFWRKLFQQVPQPFQFAFKAPEEITLPSFPQFARYGPRSGAKNSSFLNAEFFRTQFLDLLLPYRDRVAVIVFEFGAGVQKSFESSDEFVRALDRFFSSLSRGFPYAVEIRAPVFLDTEYFAILKKHHVAHVFNAWSGMPELSEQMARPDSFTSSFTVARALLRKGRTYDEAVSRFSPYREVREPNAEVRAALRHLLVRAKQRSEPTFIFVNNRLEGFAPGTIAALIEGF